MSNRDFFVTDCSTLKLVMYLTSAVLTLWDHFLFLLVLLTSYLFWIMFLNGLRQKPR